MSVRTHECLGCGEPVTSVRASIVHCDPIEPVDDITFDDTRGYD